MPTPAPPFPSIIPYVRAATRVIPRDQSIASAEQYRQQCGDGVLSLVREASLHALIAALITDAHKLQRAISGFTDAVTPLLEDAPSGALTQHVKTFCEVIAILRSAPNSDGATK